MPCCGDREKIGQMKLEQTWDYINLNDFKSSSCFTGFSYFMVWVFGLISIAVYAVDTFTAVNLLAFNKWSSQIKPKIPINISRWIFAGAIIASFLLLIYRWIKAIRVMRSGGIAETYLDPLAVRVQSVRLGKHKGYRRFLVFAELTKSKKGADYIALFSYFSFEAWLRILLADGPRQVINAITLYSVMELELIPTGHNAAPEGTSPVVQFFINIKALAEKNYQQAVILFGMLFTLIVWVIAALSLAISVILYLIFLWHHIPTADGSLRRYCRRKINTRLERIVRKKTATALAKSAVQLQDRTPTIPMDAGAELKPIKLAPTLPSVAEFPEDKKPIVTVAPLSRQPTQSSLPPYSSDPGFTKDEAYRQPKLPDLADNAWLTKTNTQDSLQNESASLATAAAPMGYSPLDNHYTQQNGHMPPGSFDSQYARSFSPAMDRPPTAQGRKDAFGQADRGDMDRYAPNSYQPRNQTPQAMMGRQTPGSFRDAVPRSYSPATDRSNERPYVPRMQTPSGRQQGPNSNVPGMRSASPAVPPLGLQQTSDMNSRGLRSESPPSNPPPPVRSFTSPVPNPSTIQPFDRTASPRPPNQGGYVAFNPRSLANNNTNPSGQNSGPFSAAPSSIARPSTTAPTYNANFNAHQEIVRAATTAPSNGLVRNQHFGAAPQHHYRPAHNEDDDEYDPLSYYGTAK